MTESRLTISVVVYRTPVPALQPLFDSLSRVKPDHVCIVDNGGDLALEAAVQQRGMCYLRAESNAGYGGGHNLGFAALAGKAAPFHLVVNPDIEFNPVVLPGLLESMQVHSDVGLLMPDIRYPDGARQYLCKLLPAPHDLIRRRFFPSSEGKTDHGNRYELRNWSYDAVADIPSLSGCFMLLRSEAFRVIGGFDPRFFMYMEDVDLCRRIGQHWRTVYDPSAHVTHHYAKGSYRSLRLLKLHAISAVQYFNKWGWLVDCERDRRNAACLKALGLVRAK